MVSENGMLFRDFLEQLHNLLRFCAHFANNFANHALSEMILLRGKLGWIILMLVVEYRSICPFNPRPPQNKYEKLHNLDF